MKAYQIGLTGFLTGVIVTIIGAGLAMPGLMLKEIQSPTGVDETVEKDT